MLLTIRNREIILNKPNFIFPTHPVIARQKPFHTRECAIKQIGRIRDVQIRIMLKHKQISQIAFQAEIRTSKRLMCVMRFACFRVCGAFVQIALVLLKPGLQIVFKVGLLTAFQRQCQLPKCFACFCFGICALNSG